MLGVHWQIGRPERWQAYDSELARLKWFLCGWQVGSRYPDFQNEIEEKTVRSDSRSHSKQRTKSKVKVRIPTRPTTI